MRWTVGLLSACAVVLALAGCGGGGGGGQLSPAEYRAQLHELGKKADAAQSSIPKGIQTGKPEGLADAVSKFGDAYEKLADKVADLNPPDNAKAANTELIAGLRASASAAHELVPQIEKASSFDAALGILQHSKAGEAAGRQTDHALAALKKLGYTTREG